MILTYTPITLWPGKLQDSWHRRGSPFKAGWRSTLTLLEHEVEAIGGDSAVLQLAVQARDINIAGGLKANVRAEHPGVIVYFDSKHGPLQYSTDAYTDWRANTRAIALALEALRAVDRYGVTRRGEQYTGFKALTAGAGIQSVAEAQAWIRDHGGSVPAALKATHPDHGGTAELLQRTLEAKALVS
ncbi:MAG: molecular chaperone DnaJ [Candidatus Dormibacteraeota bacterium]|nr:molecular chaperone DnaJ [Candidatus Dormibacteraeota bacterium]